MFVDITIFTLLILSVNCNLKIIDPEFPEYSNMEYNMSKMLSSASPYNIVGMDSIIYYNNILS